VADWLNNRVLGWHGAGAFVNGAPADIVIGQPSFADYDCNHGGLSASNLCAPLGVGVDGAGNLYVADTGNDRVLEYDSPFSTDVAADRVFGQPDLTSLQSNSCDNGTQNAGTLCSPVAVAVDNAGNLYVADWGNNRVLEYHKPLVAHDVADRVFGQPDFATNDCDHFGVNALSLCNPQGVAVDRSGRLYVADSGNSRVLEYERPLRKAIAARVFGQGSNFATSGCGSGAGALCGPSGLALDAAGDLYVADAAHDRVLEYVAPFTTPPAATRVFGQPDFMSESCNTGGISADSLCTPVGMAGVAVDSMGNLYVADSGNNRVLAYDMPPVMLLPSALSFAPQFVGSASPTLTLSLINLGSTKLDISDVSTIGDFKGKSFCGKAVKPLKSCTISATFTPAKPGTRDGSLTIMDSAGVQTVPLVGMATMIKVSPTSLSFPTQRLGFELTRLPKTVTLTNHQAGALTISRITSSSADFLEVNECDRSVGPGKSCKIHLGFDPNFAGPQFGTLTVEADAPVPNVKLSGSAEPGVILSPIAFSFGSKTVRSKSAVKTATLVNNLPAQLALRISSISIEGPEPNDFAIANTTCGDVLRAGLSCRISVLFRPTAAGPRDATLSVDHSPDAFEGEIVSLRGVGKAR
jgi:sugar lactone lactonase YvrE